MKVSNQQAVPKISILSRHFIRDFRVQDSPSTYVVRDVDVEILLGIFEIGLTELLQHGVEVRIYSRHLPCFQLSLSHKGICTPT